jgi:circadian clock protein KaiC
MDPISDLSRSGDSGEASAMLTRQIDFLKSRGVTALYASLNAHPNMEQSEHQVSSLIDTWLLVKTMEGNGERNRALYVLKSRGMAHSNQVREFLLTDRGVELADVYVGPQGVLMGSARASQQGNERSQSLRRSQDLEQQRVNLERRRESVEAQAAILWRDYQAEADMVGRLLALGHEGDEDSAAQGREQGRLRQADGRAADDFGNGKRQTAGVR